MSVRLSALNTILTDGPITVSLCTLTEPVSLWYSLVHFKARLKAVCLDLRVCSMRLQRLLKLYTCRFCNVSFTLGVYHLVYFT